MSWECVDQSKTKAAWYSLADICSQSNDLLSELQAIVEVVQSGDVTPHEVSNAANRINDILRSANKSYQPLPAEEKGILLKKVVEVFNRHKQDLDATACSRLAWLYLNIDRQNTQEARACVELGLEREPENIHCQRLQERLTNNRY